MKIRYSNHPVNADIKEYKYKYILENNEEFKGYISLFKVEKFKEKWYVPRENRKDDCVLKEGYTYLEFYEFNKNYAITAIYNENNQIVEWYIDVINKIGIKDEVPFIEDLYLDIVITNKDEIIELDLDELNEAYKTKDITKDQFQLAINTGKFLKEKYNDIKEIKKLKSFTDKYLLKMEKLIK